MDTATETLPAQVNPQTPMGLLQMAVQSNADPDKLEKLMDLQERWEAKRDAERFGEALAAFQAECPQITKRRKAEFKGQHAYNFASLDDIMRQVQPLLSRHGLSVSYSAKVTDAGMLHATCAVRCGSHVEESEITLPVPAEMRVNATQKMGAAMAYAKRYAVCNALGITVGDEDTDANGVGETVTEEQAIRLQEFAESLGKDVPQRFLSKAMGVGSFYEIPASRYGEAMDLLKRKRDQK